MVCPLLFCSRKLWEIAQGLNEEAQCIQGAILNSTSWLLQRVLLSTLSGRRSFSYHLSVNLLSIYVQTSTAKFGAVNRRINETRSSENRYGLVSLVQPPRFSVLPITWLSALSPFLNRASRTIMDISQHASSVVQRLPQIGIVEYFSDAAIPEKIKGSESCIIAMVQAGHSQNLQNRLWCWSRILILKWRVSKSPQNLCCHR